MIIGLYQYWQGRLSWSVLLNPTLFPEKNAVTQCTRSIAKKIDRPDRNIIKMAHRLADVTTSKLSQRLIPAITPDHNGTSDQRPLSGEVFSYQALFRQGNEGGGAGSRYCLEPFRDTPQTWSRSGDQRKDRRTYPAASFTSN